MPKVSVIVPVYNVEKYLWKCINSIMSQTLYDIEIICIDDGSTDDSGKILDEAAKIDSRVKVIHKENAGYGAAMNCGLEIARGEYIGIVESDDYILSNMFEVLYKTAANNNLDMIKSDAYYWIEKENFLSRFHTTFLDPFYDKVLDSLDRNYFFEFYMNIWTGIYKKSFLTDNEIKFNESPGASYQDNGFWMQTCIYANRAMWLNRAFYYYRQDNPEASVKSKGKVMAMAKEYEYLEELLKERGHDKYLPYCYTWKMIRYRGTFYRIADEMKREFCEQIKQDYDRYSPYISSLVYLNDFFVPLIRNSDETTNTIIKRKNDIYNHLSSAKDIVIYGAGIHAQTIVRILFNEGYAEKIVCFAVTSDLKTKKIGNKNIVLLETAAEIYKDALYIIAVNKMSVAHREMLETLKGFHISNYIDGTDIEANIYAV